MVPYQTFVFFRIYCERLYTIQICQWCIQAVWETGIPVWVPKLWRQKNTLSFFLSVAFFAMGLIISKWLRRQKCKQKIKINKIKRRWSEKRNCLRKCFHSFKYVIDHANVRFFYDIKKIALLSVASSVLVALPFQLRLLCKSYKCMDTQIFYLNIWTLSKSSTEKNVL